MSLKGLLRNAVQNESKMTPVSGDRVCVRVWATPLALNKRMKEGEKSENKIECGTLFEASCRKGV